MHSTSSSNTIAKQASRVCTRHILMEKVTEQAKNLVNMKLLGTKVLTILKGFQNCA